MPKESPEPKSVTINGKTYDYYAMTQKQRSMERSVRALKREKEALKALFGMDTKKITTKISRKTREYNEFCGMCGINPKPNRLRYESGTADLKKTKAWKNYEEHKKSIVETKKSDIMGETKGTTDNPDFKNSIITFMKINNKEWGRMLRNKKIIYKKE